MEEGGIGPRTKSWRYNARTLYGACPTIGRQVEIFKGSLAGYIGMVNWTRRWALGSRVALTFLAKTWESEGGANSDMKIPVTISRQIPTSTEFWFVGLQDWLGRLLYLSIP